MKEGRALWEPIALDVLFFMVHKRSNALFEQHSHRFYPSCH